MGGPSSGGSFDRCSNLNVEKVFHNVQSTSSVSFFTGLSPTILTFSFYS